MDNYQEHESGNNEDENYYDSRNQKNREFDRKKHRRFDRKKYDDRNDYNHKKSFISSIISLVKK